MNDKQLERVDGSQLLGFMAVGDTYATSVDESVPAQELYYFLKPVADYRSVDGSDEFIISWRPSSEVRERVRDWRQRGLSVPSDVRVSEETLSLLAALSAAEHETEEGVVTEISLPPLDEDGVRFIKEELLTRYDIVATGGYGVEPLRLDEEATRELDELIERPIQS